MSKTHRFDSFLARNKDLTCILSAVALGIGLGFVGVGLAEALRENDSRALRYWEGGTSALVLGLGLGAASSRGSLAERRLIWRRTVR